MSSGRTIWHVAMSLDGFTTDRDGSATAWLPKDAGPARMGLDLVPSIGAILAGRRSYDLGIKLDPPRGGRPYGGAYTGPVLVLTHRAPPDPPDAAARFVVGELADGLATARAAAGDRNVVIFGAELARQCLRAGELDEVLVHIAPVLLGAGTPAFLPSNDELRSFDVLERSAPDELTTMRLAPRNRRSP
ncbi:MAG TPA: dihydrofolate reductase family protein [Jatrophihabitans sp.]|jgi:dihydrofolate reductase|nr:dihydrofolate reductase family protein [Jatrophihabitans sp.]